jgi:hypothetical protein
MQGLEVTPSPIRLLQDLPTRIGLLQLRLHLEQIAVDRVEVAGKVPFVAREKWAGFNFGGKSIEPSEALPQTDES